MNKKFYSLKPYNKILRVLWFNENSGSCFAGHLGIHGVFRLSSTYSNKGAAVVVSLIKYENADLEKLKIIKENTGKSGVYCWVNLSNGSTYIGSSVNLGNRLRQYFNYNYISDEKRGISIICKALLKYGYSNFSVEILEYCDKSLAITREQYYLDFLKPDYNILKSAGSSLGRKFSEETMAKLKRRSLTIDQKAKLLSHLRALTSSKEHKERMIKRMKNPEYKAKILENLKKCNASKAQKIEVLDILTNKITVYPSISETAREIGVAQPSISKAFKRLSEGESTIFIKKRYKITRLSN